MKRGELTASSVPTFGTGMIALVVVGGDTDNLDALKAFKVPKKAQERLEAIYSVVGQ